MDSTEAVATGETARQSAEMTDEEAWEHCYKLIHELYEKNHMRENRVALILNRTLRAERIAALLGRPKDTKFLGKDVVEIGRRYKHGEG